MTIKPHKAQSKRGPADGEKKEPHSSGETAQHQLNVQVNSKRRPDVYDDLARQRRSPQKFGSRSLRTRRDAHESHHLKRTERDVLTALSLNSGVGGGAGGSPHSLAAAGVSAAVPSSPGSAGDPLAGVAVSSGGIGSSSTSSGSQSGKESDGLESGGSGSGGGGTATATPKGDDSVSGYNSGDEHYQAKHEAISVHEWELRDKNFEKIMRDRGYELRNVEEDGACLFRAISLQIYGDEEMHDVIRQHTMDYISKNREYFRNFVTEDINKYIKRKRRNDSHGNHIEIQAISEIYSRAVEVYCYAPNPINIFNSESVTNGGIPLRLSYQRGSHYNALIDPYNASVGEGLGLSGYKPDMQCVEATRLSEQLAIEQTMFEDKLKTTDWEATNEAIEEQIARESYLQWCRDSLRTSRNAISATITSAEAAANSEKAAPPLTFGSVSQSLLFGYGSLGGGPASTITSSAAVSTATASATSVGEAFKAAEGAHSSSASATATCTSTTTTIAAAAAVGPLTESNVGLIAGLKKGDPVAAASTSKPFAVEAAIDSDDTDRSTTSSKGSGGSARKRRAKHRNGTKRRIENAENAAPSAATRPRELSASNVASEAKLLKPDLMSGESKAAPPPDLAKRSNTPDADQKPCSSKQLKEKAAVVASAATSTTATTATASATSSEAAPISSFYQDLLASAYSEDGFDQLSESEMLQRAMQQSRADFLEEQKRLFFEYKKA